MSDVIFHVRWLFMFESKTVSMTVSRTGGWKNKQIIIYIFGVGCEYKYCKSPASVPAWPSPHDFPSRPLNKTSTRSWPGVSRRRASPTQRRPATRRQSPRRPSWPSCLSPTGGRAEMTLHLADHDNDNDASSNEGCSVHTLCITNQFLECVDCANDNID